MKTILLIRHAKSSWEEPGQSDLDRPLNDRGKKDAPMMAKRLREKKIKIDAIVSSPAKRAKKTASFFAEEYKMNKEDIIFREELYLAAPEAFYKVIQSLDNRSDHVAIFAHNNGITDFANLLTDVRIDNMPTCSVFAMRVDIEKWEDFRNAKREFFFFDYPKNEEL